MKTADMPTVERIVDDLVLRLDKLDLTTQDAIDKIDSYRDVIREARNEDKITGEEFRKLMCKLGPLRARCLKKS